MWLTLIHYILPQLKKLDPINNYQISINKYQVTLKYQKININFNIHLVREKLLQIRNKNLNHI